MELRSRPCSPDVAPANICDICGEKFTKHINLRRHMQKQHEHLAYFPCGKCGKPYKSYRDANDHERLCTHGGDLIQCTMCKSRFATPWQWRKHVASSMHRGYSMVAGSAWLAAAERLGEGADAPELEVEVLCAFNTGPSPMQQAQAPVSPATQEEGGLGVSIDDLAAEFHF